MFLLESVPMEWFFSYQSLQWQRGSMLNFSEFKELMLNAVALNAILDVDECLGRLWSTGLDEEP